MDLSEIIELGNMKSTVDKAIKDAARDLAKMTESRIKELARQRLHSRFQMYTEGLSTEEVSEDVWVVKLASKVRWIEDGNEAFSMIDSMLKSPKAKTAKDGCVLNPRNKVLTSTGWKRIKDIVPGDLVLTHSGKFREVKELLVRETPIGTEYVRILPYSFDTLDPKTEFKLPGISLTAEHPVLTKRGWIEASQIEKSDWVATPADLDRLCKFCSAPLPINTPSREFCLNNRCKRKMDSGLKRLTPEARRINGAKANAAAKASGCFERSDWGARNPKHLKVMRDASAAAMKDSISSGSWAPEESFERDLIAAGVAFSREVPLPTGVQVNAGRGKTRESVLFCDFVIPDLKIVVELDGKRWHDRPETQERDRRKEHSITERGFTLIRVPSHKIYEKGPHLARAFALHLKNHSGKLGIAWVKVGKITKGVVTSRAHVYAKKYDICLEAEEHSFCCETIFIHNSKYLVVPFEHGKGKTAEGGASGSAQNDLNSVLKSEMKRRGIPFGKKEMNADGSPKLGKLHSFDINKSPLKLHDGAGQGHGPVGEVRQGKTGTPFLEGVNIYQTAYKGKGGEDRVRKDIMTFRVVTSKQQGSGVWDHPGNDAMKFMEEGLEWARKEWETKISPEILDAILSKI